MTHDKSATLRIFLSSPSDVWPERNRAEAIIRRLSAELSDIELQAVRWEDSYYTADKSFQEQIDKPSDCDLVVCLFWSRLGSELPPMFNRADGSGRTGTEWEFEEAMEAARHREPAMPDLLVYKKTIEPEFKASEAELGLAQKRALDAFWNHWFHDEDGHFVAGFDRFASADEFADKFEKHLREWLRRRTDGVSWDIATRGSPFRGLAPFDEAHASVFFGRSTMVRRLAARLRSAAAGGFPLVFVLGASGSGKSSLVRAGLIPHLRIAGVTEPLVECWRRAVTTPDALARLGEDNLLAGLVAVLQGDGVLPELKQGDFSDPRQLTGLLATSPESATVSVLGALDRWARVVQAGEGHAQPPTTGLILVLDQFEEIFKIDTGERTVLARAISALVETGRLWLVATLRSDFYEALQAAPEWLALRERGRSFDVTAPGAADIREIVLASARAAGLRYEESDGRSLAEDLEREAAAPGVLPMLQSALEELFNERDTASGLMTLASYERLGGVQGVLAERAERVYADIDGEAQGALSEVLGRLADFDTEAGKETPVARAALLSDFGISTPTRRLADRLLSERLLLPVSDASEAGQSEETGAWSGHVRIAHESLFLRWPRAQQQLATDRTDLELRRRLNGDAAIHAAAVAKDVKAARTLLLDGLRLAEGRDLLKRRPDLLSSEARRFVIDSDRAVKSKTHRAWIVALSLIGVFALVTLFAGWSAVEAGRQKKVAQTNLETANQMAIDLISELTGEFNNRPGVHMEVLDVTQKVTSKIVKMMDRLGQDQELTAKAKLMWLIALIGISENARMQGDLSLASSKAQEALEMARVLTDELGTSEARLVLVAAFLNSAQIYEDQKLMIQARVAYTESLEMARTMAGGSDARWRDPAARSLQGIYRINMAQGQPSQARAAQAERMELVRAIASDLGTLHSQYNLVISLGLMGDLDSKNNNLSSACVLWRESLSIAESALERQQVPDKQQPFDFRGLVELSGRLLKQCRQLDVQ